MKIKYKNSLYLMFILVFIVSPSSFAGSDANSPTSDKEKAVEDAEENHQWKADNDDLFNAFVVARPTPPAQCSKDESLKSRWNRAFDDVMSGKKWFFNVTFPATAKDIVEGDLPNNPDRNVCNGLKDDELACCNSGALAAVPEFEKLVNSDEVKKSQDRRITDCLKAKAAGESLADQVCNVKAGKSKDRCASLNDAEQGFRYDGCFTLSYFRKYKQCSTGWLSQTNSSALPFGAQSSASTLLLKHDDAIPEANTTRVPACESCKSDSLKGQ